MYPGRKRLTVLLAELVEGVAMELNRSIEWDTAGLGLPLGTAGAGAGVSGKDQHGA